MKEKILAALKTAYAKLGLSDKAFDGVATLLEKTVTEESQIATAIGGDDVKALLTAIQGQVDSFRNKLSDKEKELDDYKKSHPETNKQTQTGNNDDEPAWAKTLREQNEKILARQKAEDDARALETVRKSVETKLKDAGCTNAGILALTLKGFALQKDETEDAAVTRLQAEYNASVKATFGDGAIPGVSAPAFADSKTAIEHKNDFLRSQGLLPKKD